MKRTLASLLCLMLSAAAAHAAKLAFVGATVHTLSGPAMNNAVLLVNGDVIEALGTGIGVPSGYERIDVRGKSIFPGLINGYTVLGLNEYGGLVPSAMDTNETTDPVTPQMRVTDAFQLDSRNIPVVRKYGVTHALVTPGESNVFAGQSAFVSLGGGSLSRVVVKSPVAVHINLGEPPRSTFGPRNRMPMTRMGIAASIRQTLTNAAQYRDKKAKDPTTATDLMLKSLLPVLRGELPVIVRAERLDDILTALRIRGEFNLRMILSHAADAHKVADQLAAARVPVLLGPVVSQPDSIETAGAVYENAARLAKAGVRFAIMTGGAQQAGQLPFHAGIAAAYGLDPEEALRAITLYPAQILGLGDRFGSLEAGKSASLVITDGLILQPRTRVLQVYIAGEPVNLSTWQEALYQRYRKPD